MLKIRAINIRVLLVFCLFLTGCSSRKNKHTKNNKSAFYVLNIPDVECALCAKKAITALETVSNVKYVEFVCNDTNYHDCFANVYLKNPQEPLDVAEIENKLFEIDFQLGSIKK